MEPKAPLLEKEGWGRFDGTEGSPLRKRGVGGDLMGISTAGVDRPLIDTIKR